MVFCYTFLVIDTIIYDWGGVLAPSDNKVAFSLLSKKYNIDEQHFVTFCTNAERLEESLVDDHLYTEALEKEFSIPKSEIIDALNSAHPNEVHAFAKELSEKYQTYLLSDQMEFRTEHIKKSYDLSFFSHTFFSNEVGLTKPNRDIFEYVLKNINKKPEECVFIDDKPENVQTAKEMGFATILFSSLENLKMELKEFGVE